MSHGPAFERKAELGALRTSSTACGRQATGGRRYQVWPERRTVVAPEANRAARAWSRKRLTAYEAFQLVFRDGAEKYPWDAGYDEFARLRQPALYLPAVDYGHASLSIGDRAALRVADERGWSIRMIDAPLLKWAYTIGLSDAGLPELIAMLPSANGAANMLHEAQEHLARGDLRLEDGLKWDGLGFECRWRRMHESQYLALNVFFLTKLRNERRTGQREAVEVFQLFLSDDGGRYPWDPDCKVAQSQPPLFQPFDEAQLTRGPLSALMRM